MMSPYNCSCGCLDSFRTVSPRGKRKAAETPMMEISAAKVGGDALKIYTVYI